LSDLFSPPIDHYDVVGYSEEMQAAVRARLASTRFDLIHLMGIRMMKYVPDIHRHSSVCDIVDDYALYCYRTIRYQHNVADRARWFVDWLTAISYERKYAGILDEIITVSPVDARALRRICPSASVSVIPNGVDSDHFKPAGTECEEPVIMFSGVMDYEPNITAVNYFCSSIFPRIRQKIPAARFVIVGKDPEPEVRRLEGSIPGVTVTGFVDDIRESFDNSLIYVAPIRSGAGMKNKILEAWAMEKPVVATSMSCDGIDVSPGRNILIANSPADFAKAVVSLLRDKHLRRELGANGRKKVVDDYSWHGQAVKLDMTYRRVVRR
jgi:glycosyltransferase involved in cell wall biosynthesis